MNEKREVDLDRALGAGRESSDRELAALLDQAENLSAEYRVAVTPARHERAMFVQGVAARKNAARPVRFLVPVTVLALVLFAVALLGRSAVPGQTLYAVREALATVGLARSPSEEIERRIEVARDGLNEAESLAGSAPGNAQELVFAAIGDLDRAKAFLSNVERDERTDYIVSIDRLESRAAALIVALDSAARSDAELQGEDNSGPGSGDEPGDDNSGPGNDSGDDNSGPGDGDESGDDNSGPGSGDDSGDGSGDGDNSGPGGGGDGSGDGSGDGDNSGPGGGGDSGKDSSGSGSGGDGSGDGDNSGPG